jgi:hypothetical protein
VLIVLKSRSISTSWKPQGLPRPVLGLLFTQHILKSVGEQQDMTVVWNQAIRTDGEVLANKPDKILKKINLDY